MRSHKNANLSQPFRGLAAALALTAAATISTALNAETKVASQSGVEADRALLRELIRKGAPRVKQVKDERGQVIRIEFSRHGGKNPDEVITFPAPGATLRERDNNHDGFFEERRIEHKDKDVLVERRTKADPKWRALERRTFDPAAGTLLRERFDATGEKIVSTTTEPLWSEESYADAYERCLETGISSDSNACPFTPYTLSNTLPNPFTEPGQDTEAEFDLTTALASMQGETCTSDPDFLYTGTGFLIDRRSCRNDPALMNPIASAAEQGVAGLIQCFSPASNGRPGNIWGPIHYPSEPLIQSLVSTFYEHVEVSGGIRLSCSDPKKPGGISPDAAADASFELHRIRFSQDFIGNSVDWNLRAIIGGHEFLHLTQVLGDGEKFDNQSTAQHNETHGNDSVDLAERDRVYGCSNLCLGTQTPSRATCERCLDRDPPAAASLCDGLPSRQDLDQLRVAIPNSIYMAEQCKLPAAAQFTVENFAQWKACLDQEKSRLDGQIDRYRNSPVKDPRWNTELKNSHDLLNQYTATRLTFPVCLALNEIGRDAVECRTKKDSASCQRTTDQLKTDTRKAALWSLTEQVFDGLSLLARQKFRESCVSTGN